MSTDSPKTIFVTGATGLVGGHVVEEALSRGLRVRALVRSTSDTRKLDEWGVEKIVGDLEDRDALRPRSRRRRLGLQLRGEGRRLGDARRVPPAERRCPAAAARRRRRRPGRQVRPRQLARRLRGPRPLRHRRDHPSRRRFARRLHAVQDRGRGAGPEVLRASAGCRWWSSGPASSTASATAPSCPSC